MAAVGQVKVCCENWRSHGIYFRGIFVAGLLVWIIMAVEAGRRLETHYCDFRYSKFVKLDNLVKNLV